ncbi:MAG: aminotransferase class V-fold PLP-dependent enzyme, partial [Angelakisella sp.]
NSETGSINDIAAIAAAVRRKNPNTLLHSDCVQSFCKLPVTPERWGIDLATVSGHKIHAPKGSAALYHRKGVHLLPLYYGSSQEGGLHSGTESTPAFCGMGLAAEELWGSNAEVTAHFNELRSHLLAGLANIDGICINSPSNGAPYIVNLSLPAIGSEVMIHYLEQYEIYVSGGSACAKGAKSHVLTAMGLSPQRINGALRISFCAGNTCEQVDTLLARLADGIATLSHK